MKTNNKFSIRKYSVGVVSVIIGLFILAGTNSDDRVYAKNESVPPIVSTVPEGGNPGSVDKVVDKNNEISDKGDLPKVQTPVIPGYFALEKEAPEVSTIPDKIEKEVNVDLVELGKIKYRDKKTKEIVAEKNYDNDNTNPTRAGLTTLPDLPKGYRFVNKGLDRVETREIVVHKYLEQPYVSEEVGIRVKLQEVDGKLAVDPNINIEADKFAPGHNLVFDVEEYIKDVEKVTKQVVEFVGAEGKTPKTNVQDGYKFSGEYNDETKETIWKEKTHVYSSVDVPVVKGYFADKKQAGEKEVTPEKPEVTDIVTYKHLGKIVPVDEKGNLIEQAPTPDYLNDLKDPTKALATPVPVLEGYEASVNSVLPKNPGVDTKVVYKEKLTDVEVKTKQVVEFIGAEDKAPKTNVQDDYKFKGKYHVITKETIWAEKTHAYSSVEVSVVKGYFADKKQAGGKEVTPEKPEVTDTVTYKHLGKIVPVDEKGNLIGKAPTPDYLNDLKDPTKALATPVPELKGYTPTVKSVVPKDLAKDTKVVYKKVEKPKVPEKPKETPKTPEVPKENPKTLEIPKETPKTPEVPKETPKTPEKPKKTPKIPKIPKETPKTPEKPKETPKTPETPKETPKIPEVPKKEVSEKPKTPEVHKGEVKQTPEVHKKENSKLPNTGVAQTSTIILGMLMLLLAGVIAGITRTKKD